MSDDESTGGAPAARVERLTAMRKAIARNMHASLQSTAQLTAVVEVDLTAVVEDRAARRERGPAPSPLAYVAVAVCEVLSRHPKLNSSIDLEAGTATYHESVNLGIAVDIEQGLVVPNIKGAEALALDEMSTAIAASAERARSRELTMDDMTGGTFTITNTGSRGSLLDTPILNPPEVAILATPIIEKRPVVITRGGADTIEIRSMTYLCLSYDHRMVDGADAARFLADLKGTLESPEWIGRHRGTPGA